jgi:hypothetical protein
MVFENLKWAFLGILTHTSFISRKVGFQEGALMSRFQLLILTRRDDLMTFPHIQPLRSRLEKQPIDLRRRHYFRRDGAVRSHRYERGSHRHKASDQHAGEASLVAFYRLCAG